MLTEVKKKRLKEEEKEEEKEESGAHPYRNGPLARQHEVHDAHRHARRLALQRLVRAVQEVAPTRHHLDALHGACKTHRRQSEYQVV